MTLTFYAIYRNSSRLLVIESPVDAKISLYEGTAHEDATETPIGVVSGKKLSKRVGSGTYAYTVEPTDSSYESQSSIAEIVDEPKYIKVDNVLSKSKLNSIATEKKPEIEQLLKSRFGAVFNNYTVANVQAYRDGSWLGARINTLQTGQDTYICILRVEGDRLKLVTDPPSLTIASPVYPDIPRDVIVKTNNLLKDLY